MNAVILLATAAFADPLNAWPGAAGAGESAIAPSVVASSGSTEGSMTVTQGLGNGVEMNAGFGYANAPGSGSLALTPRVFVIDQLGFAADASMDEAGGWSVGPAVHGVFEGDNATIIANIGWQHTDADTDEVALTIAPEYGFTNRLSVYMEVSPSVDLVESLPALELVPGVGISLDREGNHALSMGVGIPTGAPEEAYGGIWYAAGFMGSQRLADREAAKTGSTVASR